MRNACKTIERIEQWVEQTKVLESVLKEYADALPSESQAKLRAAMQIANATRQALDSACKVLQMEVENVIVLLPAVVTLSLGSILIIAFIASAAVVAGGVFTLNATAVDLTIQNNGCGSISLSQQAVSLPGLVLPAGPIESGKPAVVHVSTLVSFSIDATNPAAVYLRFPLGSAGPFATTLKSVTVDGGASLIIPGKSTPVNLSGNSPHTLALNCN